LVITKAKNKLVPKSNIDITHLALQSLPSFGSPKNFRGNHSPLNPPTESSFTFSTLKLNPDLYPPITFSPHQNPPLSPPSPTAFPHSSLPSLSPSRHPPNEPFLTKFKYLQTKGLGLHSLKPKHKYLQADASDPSLVVKEDSANSTLHEIINKCNAVEKDSSGLKDELAPHSYLAQFRTQFQRIKRQLQGPTDKELYAFMRANNPKLAKAEEEAEGDDEREDERRRAQYRVSYEYSRDMRKKAAKLDEMLKRKRNFRVLERKELEE